MSSFGGKMKVIPIRQTQSFWLSLQIFPGTAGWGGAPDSPGDTQAAGKATSAFRAPASLGPIAINSEAVN